MRERASLDREEKREGTREREDCHPLPPEKGERMTKEEIEEEKALIASQPEVSAKAQRTKSGAEWAAEWKAKHGKGKKKGSLNQTPNVFIAFEVIY